MPEKKELPQSVRASAKAKKRITILKAALTLFSTYGIENVSMEQISEKAEIGSATIYRYFPTKPELACQAALLLWQDLEQQYLPALKTEVYASLDGKEQLHTILNLFPAIYKEHTAFLRFLMDFDNYIQSAQIGQDQLTEYEGLIVSLKEYAEAAIRKGQEDGTISCSSPISELYFTIFHCMLSTTQKMALQGNLLPMDLIVSGEAQLNLLIQLLLAGLSTR